MQKTLLGSLLITIGAGLLALPAHAQTTLPTFGYEVSGSCLNSSAGSMEGRSNRTPEAQYGAVPSTA